MSEPVCAENLGVAYARDAWGLRGVSLAMAAGTITALIGANGSGKSTLLRALAGELSPAEGDLRLFGRSAGGLRGDELRKQVGFVAQDPALDPDMTVGETLRFFAALYGLAAGESRGRIADLFAAFELEPLARRRIARLSGGQRQRVHLAVGLLQAPALVLFDEPTNGLDPALRGAFWRLLRGFCERTGPAGHRPAAAVATHDLEDAAHHADQIVVLAGGRLVAAGSPSALLAQTGVESLGAAYAALAGVPLRPVEGGRGRRGRGRA